MDDILKIKEIRFCHDEKELLAKLRAEATDKKIPIIDDATGFLLEALCLIKKPENILEVGCGTGYSTYFLIKKLENESNYTGIDLNKERLETAKKFIKMQFNLEINKDNSYPDSINRTDRIKFLNGNALKIIPALDQKFDFVFIDAAKYEYPEYIKSLMEGKLSENSIVIADNIFYDDKIFKTQVSKHDQNSVTGLREYIEIITTSDYFENYFLNIGDGIALSFYNKKTKNS
jgi:predicted O-methyltransferase YrrM